jgi:hypothetical protein
MTAEASPRELHIAKAVQRHFWLTFNRPMRWEWDREHGLWIDLARTAVSAAREAHGRGLKGVALDQAAGMAMQARFMATAAPDYHPDAAKRAEDFSHLFAPLGAVAVAVARAWKAEPERAAA